MLTLTIQSKGIMDNHGSVTVAAPLRGPGRPPLTDVTLDDISEVEDPVKLIKINNFIHKSKNETNLPRFQNSKQKQFHS